MYPKREREPREFRELCLTVYKKLVTVEFKCEKFVTMCLRENMLCKWLLSGYLFVEMFNSQLVGYISFLPVDRAESGEVLNVNCI